MYILSASSSSASYGSEEKSPVSLSGSAVVSAPGSAFGGGGAPEVAPVES